MRIKKGFDMQEVCGMQVIVATGMGNIDFSKIINLNDTAASMWKAVVGKDFQLEDLTKALTDEYEVDEATARTDAQSTLRQWTEIGLIEQ